MSKTVKSNITNSDLSSSESKSSNLVKKSPRKFNKAKFLAIIVAVLAVFAIVFLWDYTDQLKYPFQLESKGVVVARTDGEVSIFIDDQYSRATILDKDKNIVKVIQDEEHKNGQKLYYSAAIYNDVIYIHDVTMRGYTQFIEDERINCYDLDGNYIGCCFDLNYGDWAMDVFPPRIVDFDFLNDFGAFIYANRLSGVVDVYSFDLTPSENPTNPTYYESVDFSGAIADTYIYDGALDASAGLVAVTTLYGDVYECNGQYSNYPIKKINDGKVNYALQVYYNYDDVLTVDSDYAVPNNTYFYNIYLSIICGILWVSIIYLCIFLICAIVAYFRSLYKRKQLGKIKSISLFGVGIIIILFVSVFYSINSLNSEFDEKANTISIQSSNLSVVEKDKISACIRDFAQTGRVTQQNFNALSDDLTDLSLNFASINESAVFTLYYLDNNNNLYILCKSGFFYPSGMPYTSIYTEESKDYMIAQNNESYIFSGYQDDFISSVDRVYDSNGKVVGFISAATSYTLFWEKIINNFIMLFFTLVVVFTFIVLIFFECRKFITSIWRKRVAITKKEKHPEIHMSRTVMFLLVFALEADASLMVLVAKGMLDQSMGTYDTMLLSWPAFIHSAALLVGFLLFALVTSKFSIKKLGAISALGILVFHLLTAYAVAINNYPLYLIFKFICVFFMSQVYSIPYGLVANADNETTIAKVSVDMTASSLSSGILALMLSGFVAEYISDGSIYVMGAIPAILLIIVILLTYRNVPTNDPVTIKKHNFAPAKTLKFFFSKNAFAFVFIIMGATTMTYAFRCFVFPLIGDSYGWDKSTISNILVIANIIVYVLVPLISNASKSFDYWKLIIWSMIAAAIVFAIIYIRSIAATIIFAVIAITILNKLINSYISVFMVRECEDKKFDKTKANMFTIVVRSLFGQVRAPFASWLIGFGLPVLYAVYGALSLFGGLIFGIITRNSSMRKKDKYD